MCTIHGQLSHLLIFSTIWLILSPYYVDLDWAIGMNRCMLKIVGLWPEESKDRREEFLSKFRFLINITGLIFVLTIPSLVSLIRVWGDMILMIDNLQYTLPFLILIMKNFIMWYRRGALSTLVNMVVTDWMRVKVEEERSVMIKQARITRFLSMCGALMVLFSATMLMMPGIYTYFGQILGLVTNVTDYGKLLPFQVYYLHDVSSSPNYELTYLAQVIAMFASSLSYTSVDNFLGLLIFHICGQLENLHIRLLNLEKDSNFKAVLKYNVKDHIRLIRSIKVIDNTFNLILLCLLFFFGILFCLQGFLIMNVMKRNSNVSIMQLTWYVSATICVLMHTCLYCVVGEFLVSQSEKIHLATYEYVWYTLKPKAARNLILIMVRTKKPLNITAGKIFPMTMSTFCDILKTSASFISVLLANRD